MFNAGGEVRKVRRTVQLLMNAVGESGNHCYRIFDASRCAVYNIERPEDSGRPWNRVRQAEPKAHIVERFATSDPLERIRPQTEP